jgi:rhomboid family protein
MFLHIGFWHIAFNLLAIATLGPQVEQIWGRLSLLFIFIVTGIAGFAVSAIAQPDALTAGASGGVCGLLGAAAGWGQRLGNTRGRLIRNDMIKWFVYTIVFGLAVHANNWAHAGGALSGFLFGYFVPSSLWKRSLALRAIAKSIGVAGTVAALAIIMTRQPTPPAPSQTSVSIAMVDFQAQVCRLAKVDPAGAQALIDIMLPHWGFPTEPTEVLCSTLVTALRECRDGRAIEGMSANDRHAYCDPIERALADF